MKGKKSKMKNLRVIGYEIRIYKRDRGSKEERLIEREREGE